MLIFSATLTQLTKRSIPNYPTVNVQTGLRSASTAFVSAAAATEGADDVIYIWLVVVLPAESKSEIIAQTDRICSFVASFASPYSARGPQTILSPRLGLCHLTSLLDFSQLKAVNHSHRSFQGSGNSGALHSVRCATTAFISISNCLAVRFFLAYLHAARVSLLNYLLLGPKTLHDSLLGSASHRPLSINLSNRLCLPRNLSVRAEMATSQSPPLEMDLLMRKSVYMPFFSSPTSISFASLWISAT